MMFVEKVDAKNGGKRELASNFEELMNIVKADC